MPLDHMTLEAITRQVENGCASHDRAFTARQAGLSASLACHAASARSRNSPGLLTKELR